MHVAQHPKCKGGQGLKIIIACALGLVIALSHVANAEPMLDPGDSGLRSDIQILADSGIILAPVTTWPISWAAIASDVMSFDKEASMSEVTANAYYRVKAVLRNEMRTGNVEFAWNLSGAAKPTELRTFENTPRENGEASAGLRWMGDAFAFRLEGQAESNAQDNQTYRMDNSYLAYVWKNQIFAISTQNRWWGPGWDGSLILSSNARPIPAITIQRNLSTPFETKWLSWIGPWSYSFIYGQMEHNRDVPLARFMGFRFDFRPLSGLEIALSRTAQWCGSGRPCSFGTFWDVLTASGENTGSGQSNANEPGNQLAAIDVRWAPNPKKWPLAVYVQGTAEDEAGNLPSRWIGLGGLEVWGQSHLDWLPGTYRFHIEYANTLIDFYKNDPLYNLAYNSSIYTTGYRYRGRVVGHSMDNDGEMLSFGLILDQENGIYWNALLRRVRLNTNSNPTNSVAAVEESLWNVQLIRRWPTPVGDIKAGIGYDFYDNGSPMSDEGRIFLEWRNSY